MSSEDLLLNQMWDLIPEAVVVIGSKDLCIKYYNKSFSELFSETIEEKHVDGVFGKDKFDPKGFEMERKRLGKGKKLRFQFSVTHLDEEHMVIHGTDISKVYEKDAMLRIYTKMIDENNRKLNMRKEEFRNILNSMNHALFTVDDKLEIKPPTSEYCKQIFGEDIEGKRIDEVLFCREQNAKMISLLESSFASEDHEESCLFEDKFKWKDKTLRVKITPIYIKEKAYRVLFNIEDISYTLELENQLVDSLKKAKESELQFKTAQALQETLIKEDVSDNPYYDIASFYQTAEHTGGDWFGHFFDEKSNLLYIFCADVTGHGIPSALVTGVISGTTLALKNYIQFYGHRVRNEQQNLEVMAKIFNDSIYNTGRKAGRLTTMFICTIDLHTGLCSYVNAGHNFPIHIQPKHAKAYFLKNSGFRLGYKEKVDFKVKTTYLDEDDLIFFYTDGLIENRSPEGDTFSLKKVRNLAVQCHSAKEMIDVILKAGTEVWGEEHKPEDDCSFLVFHWKEKIERKIDSADGF